MSLQKPWILGIESSCDDTGVALMGPEGLAFEWIHHQVDVLQCGGVIPELAARQHGAALSEGLKKAFDFVKNHHISLNALSYAAGPGLLGSLRLGGLWAQLYAWHHHLPLMPLDHLEAHLFSPFIGQAIESLPFPFLALLVSGGHTALWEVRGLERKSHRLLDCSPDDAAGEAFDKAARWMGLGYPGGPRLEACAAMLNEPLAVNLTPTKFKPSSFLSFSGLKSEFKREWSRMEKDPEMQAQSRPHFAAAMQAAVGSRLLASCKKFMTLSGINNLAFVGGVSANRYLQGLLKTLCESKGGELFYAPPKHTGDNGAMIAYLGFLRWQAHQVELRDATAPLKVYGTTAMPRLADTNS